MQPLRVMCISIDDFYYSHQELLELQNGKYAQCKLLHGRGLPGSHCLKLGRSVLDDLISAHTELRETGIIRQVAIPRYGKSAFGGLGDRIRKSEWTVVSPPFDIILFEGWMLGFKAIDDLGIIASLDQDVCMVNEELFKYEQCWHSLLDARTLLRTESMSTVYDWRWEQEESMRESLQDPNAGMSREQCDAFVDRFMPCYELYLEPYLRNLPSPNLVLTLDKLRRIVHKVSN